MAGAPHAAARMQTPIAPQAGHGPIATAAADGDRRTAAPAEGGARLIAGQGGAPMAVRWGLEDLRSAAADSTGVITCIFKTMLVLLSYCFPRHMMRCRPLHALLSGCHQSMFRTPHLWEG